MAALTMGNGFSVEELRSWAWTREITPDGDGFFGRIQELEGCISTGATPEEALINLEDALFSWLEVAIEQGVEVPRPGSDLDEYSGRFSVRVPRALHRALVTRSQGEGTSLNQLVTWLLGSAIGVNRAEPAVARAETNADAHEEIVADAVRMDLQGVGALKGIATWLRNRGDIKLAVLLYALAGDRGAMIDGSPQLAASDFGVAGALARRHRHIRLAEACWRESLRRDPTNIRTRSSLGQLLQHQGRFEEAIECLEGVAEVDNYAQLSLGWSLIYQGLARQDQDRVTLGTSHLATAMRRWCVYANRSQLSPWLRQLARLDALGSSFADEVDHLLGFANSNANWGKLDRSKLQSLPTEEDPEEADEQAALEASGTRSG